MSNSKLKQNKHLQIKLFGLLLRYPVNYFSEECCINTILTGGDKLKTAEVCCSCFYCEGLNKQVHNRKDVISSLLKDFPYLLKYFPSYLLEEKI